MLRTLLFVCSFILCCLTILAGYVKFYEPRPISQLSQPQPVIPETKPPEVQVHPLIQQVNERNSQINTFSCDNVQVKIWQTGMRFKLTAKIYYEKQDRFRLIISSLFGPETDLGSNDEVFWFWSRRHKRDGLFWAKHEDYNKTRLKTPFNPIFMKMSLGLNEIDVRNAKVVETEKDFIVLQEFKNSMGKRVLRSTFVNKIACRVEGVLITDINAVPLASAEITEFERGLPKKILYTWHEESQILELTFVNPVIGSSVNPANWEMPNIQPKINMGEELYNADFSP